jgi:hypothetical protein
MLRLFFGKELTSKIAKAVEDKTVNIAGQLIDTKHKIGIEKDKLEFEREKFDFEKNRKFSLEMSKLDLEKQHKEESYKYPANSSANSRERSAHIRGAYSLFSNLIIVAVTYWYIDSEKKKLTKKSADVDARSVDLDLLLKANNQLNYYSLQMQKIEDECDKAALDDPNVNKSQINEVKTLCKNQSMLYNECLTEIKILAPKVESLQGKLK